MTDGPGWARRKLYGVLPIEDYDWVEVEIEDVSEAHIDGWRVHLAGKEGGSCTVVVNSTQLSAVMFAKSGLLEQNLFPTSHQMLGSLAHLLGAKLTRTLIEAQGDGIVAFGKVEFEARGKKFFLNTSAGEAIATAVTCGTPLFVLKGMMRELDRG